MTVAAVDRSIIFVSVLCNFALTILLWGSLRGTSDMIVDVLDEVQSMDHNTALIQTQITEVRRELDRRAEWMAAVDTELTRRTKDRIYRAELEKWRAELQRINATLTVPEIPREPVAEPLPGEADRR